MILYCSGSRTNVLAEAQCNHPVCVGKHAKITVSRKRPRESAEETITPAQYALRGSRDSPAPTILSGLYRQFSEKVSAESSMERLRNATLSDANTIPKFGRGGTPFMFPGTKVRAAGGSERLHVFSQQPKPSQLILKWITTLC